MFVSLLKKINIVCSSEQLKQLEKYFELLQQWNEKMNLTTIINKEEVYQKHFFDSLLLTKNVVLEQQLICDVGTGAGFPGIVIKILFPKIKLFLVEAITKKCLFLQVVVENLFLKDVTIINNRVENIAIQYRDFFDIVTVRAVAKLNMLLELCVPIVKVKGIFIALKSETREELSNSQNALKVLNTKLISIYSSNWDFLGKRTILYFIKQKAIDKLYPRDFAKIKQQPL
ncbi:16S rRNA (guanine(527)-N(7))-methyltransferase RsmG [Spiroplasma endosymbiont of Asaphidion curtum]|uniref:16S rRNA (guanine(527)-N(7))-methyltransferase RsmG n=1 Tax=Spiroplasma endosymbiont of Asaphidion curtum TaxID=3066281 RepID=UPI00313BDF1E